MSHRAWIEQAESDLAAANALSAASFHAQAVWLAAQAVEKGHKAILAALGLRYEDKHYRYFGHGSGDIAKLLPAELQEPIDPRVAVMVASLETKAQGSRYPAPSQSSSSNPTRVIAPSTAIRDSQADLSDARQLLDWCAERVARAERAVSAMKP